jgi:hypothetical protein
MIVENAVRPFAIQAPEPEDGHSSKAATAVGHEWFARASQSAAEGA